MISLRFNDDFRLSCWRFRIVCRLLCRSLPFAAFRGVRVCQERANRFVLADEKGAFMSFDFKKEYKDLYLPKNKSSLVEVPPMTFFAVAGTGDPNEPDGAYARALELLYGLSYTVRMAKMGAWQPEGYFDYVVPPLEGLWWAGAGAFDGALIADKQALSWVSLIRQPDFVTPETLTWACTRLAEKKPALADACEAAIARVVSAGVPCLVRFAEGLCVQAMHRGPYDDEPATIAKLAAFVEDEGLVCDIAEGGEPPAGRDAARAFDTAAVLTALDANGAVPGIRLHHEIYLSDPRRSKPENLKTVVRHPVCRM